MLLKIHLLQVMSIGLITVPVKAQEPSLTEVPELYMQDSDKALLTSIWNMAGFPSDQSEQDPEVTRKFVGIMKKVGSGVLKRVIPHVGKIPGFPDALKPVLPVITTLLPARMIDLTGIKHTINNNRQHTESGRSYADSSTTMNYKGLKQPFNSELYSSEENDSPELISNRRALHLTENLKTSQQDLDAVNLALEQMKRMIQDVDENKLINKKSWIFLQGKTHQKRNVGEQSRDITTDADISSRSLTNNSPFDVANIRPYDEEVDPENKNFYMDFIHKKEYKIADAARNSNTSSHHPMEVSHKWDEKRKESSRTSDKSPKTSKYYEMLQNNQMIHNVEGYNSMMHQYPNQPRTNMFQQLRDVRSATVDETQLPYEQNKVTE